MCDRCHKPSKASDILITSGNGFSAEYCVNCISEMSTDPILIAPEGIFSSDISNVKKACRFATKDYEYYFTPEEAKRFYGLCLLPNEYKILSKRPDYADELLISDEFYTNDGLAFQPLDEKAYVKSINDYLANNKISRKDRKEIKEFIKIFDD